MKSMELSPFQAGLTQSAFYMGYFVFAVPAALLMRQYNYKTGIVLGLFMYTFGCVLFLQIRLEDMDFSCFPCLLLHPDLPFLKQEPILSLPCWAGLNLRNKD